MAAEVNKEVAGTRAINTIIIKIYMKQNFVSNWPAPPFASFAFFFVFYSYLNICFPCCLCWPWPEACEACEVANAQVKIRQKFTGQGPEVANAKACEVRKNKNKTKKTKNAKEAKRSNKNKTKKNKKKNAKVTLRTK